MTTIVSSELFGAMSHTAVGTVAAVGRLVYPALKERRLRRPLHGEPDRVLGRHRSRHSALDRDDPLQHVGAAIGDRAVHRRHPAKPADRARRRRLCHPVLADAQGGGRREDLLAASGPRPRKPAGRSGTPIVIFGGIYGGIFTPTEAAGVAAVYSIVVTMFIYRDIGWRDLWRITLDAVFLISQILIIVTAAGIYSWLLTTSGIPQKHCRRP